jgi:predicted DNA binding CopG/RHH family protein
MTGRGEDTGRDDDMKKSIPDFKSPEEEAKFWEEHSIMEFVSEEDVSDFLRFGGNKSAVVTLRMEPLVREQTKRIAKDMGKSYQTLMREWIYGGLTRALEEKYGGRGRESEPLMKLVIGLKKDVEEIKGAIHQRS